MNVLRSGNLDRDGVIIGLHQGLGELRLNGGGLDGGSLVDVYVEDGGTHDELAGAGLGAIRGHAYAFQKVVIIDLGDRTVQRR